MTDTRTQILDLAERAIRLRGYHAVSFRDLADEMGIKSASIHYHFRQKHDLGLAVVDRYATRIADLIGPAGALDWPEALRAFCDVYKDALYQSDLQCLCSILASESSGLPDEVADRVAEFFRNNINWLMASLPDNISDKRSQALAAQTAVQGAMTVAVSLKDYSVMDLTIERLCAPLQ
ncbi:TetR/AcrR family transcriptional regulator [Roseovarius sp. EL26]|uniref:TetR/AcrR family transcriptional regulator n=1 Tax=Roseovarius sp. EL26 TaxID=2126672 RepID=UPI000EA29A25|nr:TetR/AcrR family transcriptional regulator [Roseovarius sp. EL26]